MELEPGTWIDGRYKILRFLGKGSEGSVYLAFQEKLFRFYAIKEVEKEGICFSRESMEVWKRLQCEGLPEIVDILEEEERIWIVMEYIEGENLQDYLRKISILPAWRAADWCLQVLDVLEYLHRQNPPILYGDLKPDNIILRKNRVILVDMGSLIRKGSQGKRTGTRAYIDSISRTDQGEDCYSFGKFMEVLALRCQSCKMKKWSEKVMKQAQKGQTYIAGSIKRKLKNLKRQRAIEGGLLCGTALLLLLAGRIVSEQTQQENREEVYHNCIAQLQEKPVKEKEEQLLSLIAEYPQQKDAYLELIKTYRDDCEMNQEEDHSYRKLWKEQPPGRTENYEELLKKNPEAYQEVAFESGLTYWYFFKGIQRKTYAAAWFRKVTEVPREVCQNQEIWDKSMLYGKLCEYQEKWKRYDETGEKGTLFSSYWSDITHLLKKENNSISMVRMLLWKDALAAWKHYMVELREEGVERNQIEMLLAQMKKELTQIPEGHQRMQELKKQLEEEEQQMIQMLERIYQ